MSIESIRALLESQQASIRLVDEKLSLRGPGNALKNRDLIALIKNNRDEILRLLREGESFDYESTTVENIPDNLLDPKTEVITPDLLPLLDITQDEIDHIVASVPGGVEAIQDIYPLTPLQEGMLFHYLMAEKGDPYLMWSIFAFADRETLNTFVETFNVIISRHDILRTCFRWEGLREPVQIVLRDARVSVEEVDINPDDGDIVEQMKARFNPVHYRLDLQYAPLIKLLIAKDEQNDRLIVMRLQHHLTTDRTTGDVISSEIMAVMSGQGDKLPKPIPYRNFVAHVKSIEDNSQHEEFFRNLLRDVDQTTAPFGLLDVHRDGSGIIERSEVVGADISIRLSKLARSQGISLTSILHVAWGYVLARVCNTDKPVFGTVMFGRMETGGSNDRILGLSINTLPVVVHTNEPVVECVRNMRDLLVDLLHHEHAPLTVTQKASNLPTGVPLFTSVINYRHSGLLDRPQVNIPGVTAAKVSFIEQHEGNNYPLTLSVDEYASEIQLSIQAATGIDPDLVLSLTKTAIASIVEALEQDSTKPLNSLAILTEEDELNLFSQWRGSHSPEDAEKRCIHHYFEEQVDATPNNVAVREAGATFTYRELEQRATELAANLQRVGVGKSTVVGLCLPRSVNQIAALLAIFKAGGTYLPLDPDYPTDRLNYLIEDSGCDILVTTSTLGNIITKKMHCKLLIDQLDALQTPQNLTSSMAEPDDVAYLLYTSGSTGKPKGVVGLHRMLTCRLLPERKLRDGTEIYGQKTSINFIDSFWEIFLPLTTGATIEIIPGESVQDPAELCHDIDDRNISHIVLVPTLLAGIASHLQNTGGKLPGLRYCVASGEPLSVELANRIKTVLPHIELINIYGTTEFWDATFHQVIPFEPGASVPIGYPMPNISFYVLDELLRPVPPGVEGELYVISPGMGPGYKGKDELTAKVFVPCPFELGQVMYRTGDRVCWHSDIGLEYLGRIDNQLNVHGFRIEPSEIETAMVAHPDVEEAVIVARDDDMHLAGYVVPTVRDKEETIPFGLFYFSDSSISKETNEMELYIESVKEADRLGFNAIWTPERHFTHVAASFPNPSVLSAAAAMVTQNIQLRSGSVVLPLHDPLRVAEEWSVVDRLSGGRVALSFASGWVPDDFVLAPKDFDNRHEVMLKKMEEVRELWRGGTISRLNGVGATVEVAIQPRPIQPELPTWVTAAGAVKTFTDAGLVGANVLTHVLNMTTDGLAEKITAYRNARKKAGFDPVTGKVAVMLHTYVKEDAASAIEEATPYLENYFRSQLKLRKSVGEALGLEVQTDQELSDEVIKLAVERFLATKALIGSPESCKALVREIYDAGVDEIACLIDFGLPERNILENLKSLNQLRKSCLQGIRTSDMNSWLAGSLPSYMCPNSITVLEQLPQTPNGKIDRLALPDPRCGRSKPSYVAPRNSLEEGLASIWAEVLRLEKVGISDRFFDLGGNSVSAIRMINRVQKSLGVKISMRELFQRQTIAAFNFDHDQKFKPKHESPLLKLSQGDDEQPLFCVHGGIGDASSYAKLCSYVKDQAVVYAFQYPAMLPGGSSYSSMTELARAYIDLIKGIQPDGPYRLLGWSFGGLVVYEMSRQLQASGEEVSFLCMLDALIATGKPPREKWSDRQALFYMMKVYDLIKSADDMAEVEKAVTTAADDQQLLQRALEFLKQRQIYPESYNLEDLSRNLSAIKEMIHMSMHYRPGRYAGNLVYVRAMDEEHNLNEVVGRWASLIDGSLDLKKVNVRHNRMFEDTHIGEIGTIVSSCLSLEYEDVGSVGMELVPE